MMKTSALLLFLLVTPSFARPSPQWAGIDPVISQWFQALKQPDMPNLSCCGEADAYEADNFGIEGDHYVAVITDGRGSVPTGTRIPVPNSKVQPLPANPTGHGYIFLSGRISMDPEKPPGPNYVAVLVDRSMKPLPTGMWLYCYAPPSGV